jgi:hypothetical protein
VLPPLGINMVSRQRKGVLRQRERPFLCRALSRKNANNTDSKIAEILWRRAFYPGQDIEVVPSLQGSDISQPVQPKCGHANPRRRSRLRRSHSCPTPSALFPQPGYNGAGLRDTARLSSTMCSAALTASSSVMWVESSRTASGAGRRGESTRLRSLWSRSRKSRITRSG